MKYELAEVIKALKNYMGLEEEAGLYETALKGLVMQTKSDDGPAAADSAIYEDKAKVLVKAEKNITACRECDLYKTRRNVVFGEGNPKALLMFVGEAPGMEEDIQGRPFVGMAGQLLSKIIEAMGMKRDNVYIANCLKCRPPKNRPPLPSEIVACRNYLQQQIDAIKPKIICCLGRPAAQTILMTDSPIGKLRGKFYDYNGIAVMPTFHPAYLLRNPGDKKLAWEDFKKIRDFLTKKQ